MPHAWGLWTIIEFLPSTIFKACPHYKYHALSNVDIQRTLFDHKKNEKSFGPLP